MWVEHPHEQNPFFHIKPLSVRDLFCHSSLNEPSLLTIQVFNSQLTTSGIAMSTNWAAPITLTGNLVTLRPLSIDDTDELTAAASDGKLWELWYTSVPKPEETKTFIEQAIAETAAGLANAFAIVDNKNGLVVGSTRFLNLAQADRRLEIGHTFYAQSVQRTCTNTETKYLLLKHLFETFNCIAVEFRTHWHNQASRNAIARLGAKQDGVLRNHRIMPNGSFRDTVVFSILDNEWPSVKTNLEFKLARHSEQ